MYLFVVHLAKDFDVLKFILAPIATRLQMMCL